MNTHSIPVTAPRLQASQPIALAVRLDWQHNTAVALLAEGHIEPAERYFRDSLHTRIERAAHLRQIFARQLGKTLDAPPPEVQHDATRRLVWRRMAINTNHIECLAAIRRVMRGEA